MRVRALLAPTVARPRAAGRAGGARSAPAVLALGLLLLSAVALAARLDAVSDGSVVRAGWAAWRHGGVAVNVWEPARSALRPGDVVTAIGGHRLVDGFGGLAAPAPGSEVAYDVIREGRPRQLDVVVERSAWLPILQTGWGNLVFVVALAALAVAMYVRRPEEPATAPLLVTAAGLLGSSVVVGAGLPALALATAGPALGLYHLSTVGAYSVAWGGVLAFSLLIVPDHPWLGRRRTALAVAYAAPLGLLLIWAGVTAGLVDPVPWLGLVYSGQTAVVMATLLTATVIGIVAFRRRPDPVTRSRLRWLFGGSMAATALSTAGWHLPELLAGRPLLPSGAIGLSALPFVAGIAVALRRHRLFDIERLANRSLVYLAVLAVLATGYATIVAILVSGLRLSGAAAAAIAAAAAALALSPLRSGAQRVVNRIMYGERDDPAGVLARLGARMQAVLGPDEVFPAVVETVATSLRLPYAALDLADRAGGFRTVAERGSPVGEVHVEPITHSGVTVGRLRVSGRGRDDPLEPVDLELVASLARQVGPAIEAVRLQADLARSRAEVVALREEERRRLRRDLHDGLGPALAAIGLKAGLAARQVARESAAGRLLGEIDTEVKAGLADVRRLVEALRPPALDELGLVGAVRSRAATLTGELQIEVDGPAELALPAAVETAAYRIAVEAVTNAARHSGGTTCRVSIGQGPHGWLELTVGDNGSGLDPARTPGVGLRSMRERAAEVGGDVVVQSPPGGGTVVTARLPLQVGGTDDHADPR